MHHRPEIQDGSGNCVLDDSMKLLSEGAEAKIYEQKLLGKPVLLKVRVPKAYRIAEIDNKLRKSRTKREAKIILRANESKINSPMLLAVGKFTICMSYIKGTRMDETKFENEILGKVGELLSKLHKFDIAHGDFTTANIIISQNSPFVIDFGLSEVTKSSEEKAMDLLLMKRSITEAQWRHFLAGYKKPGKAGLIISKLEDIERRGRYKIRTLTTV